MQLHWLWMSGYFKTILNNHVNQASVASKNLMKTLIAVPPEAEQERIVAALEGHLSHLEAAESSVQQAGALCLRLTRLVADAGLKEFGRRRMIPLEQLLREPLRNGHSAKATDGTPGIRTLTLTAVTTGQFSDEHTKDYIRRSWPCKRPLAEAG